MCCFLYCLLTNSTDIDVCGSFYIGFSFHSFKIQLSQTLQRYIIFMFFINMHVHGQPEHVMGMTTNKFNVYENSQNDIYWRL